MNNKKQKREQSKQLKGKNIKDTKKNKINNLKNRNIRKTSNKIRGKNIARRVVIIINHKEATNNKMKKNIHNTLKIIKILLNINRNQKTKKSQKLIKDKDM